MHPILVIVVILGLLAFAYVLGLAFDVLQGDNDEINKDDDTPSV